MRAVHAAHGTSYLHAEELTHHAVCFPAWCGPDCWQWSKNPPPSGAGCWHLVNWWTWHQETVVTDQCLCLARLQPCQASCFHPITVIYSLQLISWGSTWTAVVQGMTPRDHCAGLMSHLLQLWKGAVHPPSPLCHPCLWGSHSAPPWLPRVREGLGICSPRSWGRGIFLPICWRLDKICYNLRLCSKDTWSCTASVRYMQISQKSL